MFIQSCELYWTIDSMYVYVDLHICPVYIYDVCECGRIVF